MNQAGLEAAHGPFQGMPGCQAAFGSGLARGQVQTVQFRRLEEIEAGTGRQVLGQFQALVQGRAQAEQALFRAQDQDRDFRGVGGEEAADQLRAEAAGIAQGDAEGPGHASPG